MELERDTGVCQPAIRRRGSSPERTKTRDFIGRGGERTELSNAVHTAGATA